MPGGDGDYWDLGQFIFDQVKQFNDDGHFFPAWATCLGYDNIVGYSASAGNSTLDPFSIDTASLPLKFTVPPFKTRMYEGLGPKAFAFEHHNYTYNSHNWGVKPETFETDAGLKQFWDVTAVSLMPNNGTAFVASIEAKEYPMFATQFHPEKPSELWVDGRAINHEWESIELQRHFSELLVGMARTNENSYGNFKATAPHLIQNAEVIETEEMADVYVFA
uniref:folate gamma-glutamyl hydrolase n=1 Tax=Strombidium inclinatum TaxID=197538 RepID=A0A7S3IFR7_9SPIT|mmetsp:Transcript_1394/g.1854  ORF Transcript_1394/g.1854 Transcript_1394/m.1854 type:complete len:220 (+) Transcript_1394:338-997(+)